jgi:hypothetical protein
MAVYAPTGFNVDDILRCWLQLPALLVGIAFAESLCREPCRCLDHPAQHGQDSSSGIKLVLILFPVQPAVNMQGPNSIVFVGLLGPEHKVSLYQFYPV